jgi:hypothetical protein
MEFSWSTRAVRLDVLLLAEPFCYGCGLSPDGPAIVPIGKIPMNDGVVATILTERIKLEVSISRGLRKFRHACRMRS